MTPNSGTIRGSLTAADLKPLSSALRKDHTAIVRAYPGEPEDRQPVHTVYGGAHLFRADSARKLGAVALAALDEYAPDAQTPPRRAAVRFARRGSGDVCGRRPRPDRGEAASRAGRGFPHRFRGRLRQPTRRRRRRPRGVRGPGSCGCRGRRHAPSVHRHPDQAAVEGALHPEPPHPRPVRHHPGARRVEGAPGEFRRHHPEDHAGRPGDRGRPGLFSARAAASPETGGDPPRADDRDSAVDHRARRVFCAARPDRGRRGAGHRRPLRHLRLHRPLRHYRGLAAHAPRRV